MTPIIISKIVNSSLKFKYSEKAIKFENIFHLKFDATQYSVMSNSKWKIFSNFVAF